MSRAGRAALIGATLLAAALAGTWAACGGADLEIAEAPAPVPPAAAPAAAAGEPFVGVLTARRSAVVAALVEARVEEVLVHLGEQVAAGQPVARLDRQAIRQRLAAAVAEADAARAAQRGAALEVDDARHKLALERKLYRDGITSRESVRAAQVAIGRAESALSQAAASARAAAAAAAELERQLAATLLTAPMAGVVTDLRARPGELLPAGTPVMRVLDPSELRLRFAVPADRAAEVARGARVELDLPGAARPVSGLVEQLAPELEPPLRLVLAEASVDPASAGAARAGAVGTVRLIGR